MLVCVLVCVGGVGIGLGICSGVCIGVGMGGIISYARHQWFYYVYAYDFVVF